MDDLRQKLFPIFLKEAERNLLALRRFLRHETLFEANAEELETAFRAAHTLKGTANLVKAESIFKISRRLERMLEKHYEAGTVPTAVEHEALKLAVDWLAPLISALQGDLEEPTLFVSEALQALDLAEAFPGRTPLVELLDSQEQKRAPLLDDPFAGDPDLLDEVAVGASVLDPFAEDPAFGLEVALVSGGQEASATDGAVPDPFADDADFTAAENFLSSAAVAAAGDTQVAEALPYDPFADDTFDLESEPAAEGVETDENGAIEPGEQIFVADPFADDDYDLISAADSDIATKAETVSAPAESVPVAAAPVEDPFAEDDYQLEVAVDREAVAETVSVVHDTAAEPMVPAVVEDPFAEDDFALVEEIEAEVGADAEVVEKITEPQPVSVSKRVEEFAKSLLLPDRESAPRKDYVCCVFRIGERDYHLPIKQMREIADLPQLLPLPLAPPMVSGLVNLRGQVLPVVNLSILNRHQQDEVRVKRRIVVAEHQGESLAFLVDGVPYLAEEFNGEKIEMTKFLSLYRVRGGES